MRFTELHYLKFKNNMGVEHIILDDLDIKIINIMQKKCDVTHEEIASELKLTQPSVSSRIKKFKSCLRYKIELDKNYVLLSNFEDKK